MITIIPVIELEAKLRGDITISEKAPNRISANQTPRQSSDNYLIKHDNVTIVEKRVVATFKLHT